MASLRGGPVSERLCRRADPARRRRSQRRCRSRRVRAAGSRDRPGRPVRPADVRGRQPRLPRPARGWRPEVRLPGERHLALHRSGGDALQDDGRSEAGRHPLPQLLHRASRVAMEGRQLRRGRANADRAGRPRHDRLAVPAGGRDKSGSARADHLDPAAEYDRRRESDTETVGRSSLSVDLIGDRAATRSRRRCASRLRVISGP
jgi:hypothetical protein